MKKIIIFTLIIVIILLCIYYYFNLDYKLAEENSTKISDTIKNNIGKDIEFQHLFAFDWDSLNIIWPYTIDRELNDIFGIGYKKLLLTGIESRDDINLLVFRNKGNIIGYLELKRSICDFTNIERADILKRNDSTFKVHHSKKRGFILYYLPKNSKFKNIDSFMNGQATPIVFVENKLLDIIEFSNFKYLSGMTCKIKYNGSVALPKWIYYEQLNIHGKILEGKNKMIYRKLRKDEVGQATFIKMQNPDVIKIFANWSGEYHNPY